MFPKQAFFITGVLFIVGLAVGSLTDFIVGKGKNHRYVHCNRLEIHGEEQQCVCFPRGKIVNQWRRCSAARSILVAILSIIIISITLGQLGPPT